MGTTIKFLYLLIIAIGVYIFRQVPLEPFSFRRGVIAPLAVTGFLVYSMVKHGSEPFSISGVFVLLAAAGIITGIISGLTTKVTVAHDGKQLVQGGWLAIAFPLMMIAVPFLIKAVLGSITGAEILNNLLYACLIPVTFQLFSRGLTIFLRISTNKKPSVG